MCSIFYGRYHKFSSVKIAYHGKAAHATAFPFHGVNALDAAVLCYQGVACMRQQFKPDWRVMGELNYLQNKNDLTIQGKSYDIGKQCIS